MELSTSRINRILPYPSYHIIRSMEYGIQIPEYVYLVGTLPPLLRTPYKLNQSLPLQSFGESHIRLHSETPRQWIWVGDSETHQTRTSRR
jgi:hypothetical protein